MKIAIYGRSEILLNTALMLLDTGQEIVFGITAKAAPEYHKDEMDFEQIALSDSVYFACGASIVKQEVAIRRSGAEIGVNINFKGIISQEIIDLFRFGIINMQGGDLPRYRGKSCQTWAIINSEDRIGLCIHRMVVGELGSGDINERRYLPINPNIKFTDVRKWMGGYIPELHVSALSELATVSKYALEKQSVDPEDALRCYPRNPEDGKIDWSCSAIDVVRLISASCKPYCGAYCYYRGEKLIVWDGYLVQDGENYCAAPGQVTRLSNGMVEVACGDAKIALSLVEYQGAIVSPTKVITSIRTRLK